MAEEQSPPFPTLKLKHYAIQVSVGIVAVLLAANVFMQVAVHRIKEALLPGGVRRTTGTEARIDAHHPAPIPSGCREGMIRANGCNFHYVEAGSTDKPLILCLHGFPEFWYSWRHVLTAVGGSARCRVVAADLRGYGGTRPDPGWPCSAYSMPVLVEDIRCLIEAFGYKEATIFAHDWGAIIAWCFAGAYPRMVTRMAVLAVPHPRCFLPNAGLKQALRSLYILLFQLPVIPELYLSLDDYHAISACFLGTGGMGVIRRDGPTSMTEADADHYKWCFSQPGTLTAALSYYRNMLTINQDTKVAAGNSSRNPLPFPVLHLWGERDGALGQELTRGTDRYCSDYRLIVIKNCSHWIQQDAVEECVGYLEEFVGIKKQ